MSVKELELRIDNLSTEIDRQKEVLKHLESSRSATQRQLNTIRDPMARLPLEVSSEIFMQSLPARPGPQASDAPLLFLNICNAWVDIALSTPALWAAIHVDKPLVDLASLLDAWLTRAGSRALSISLPKNLTADIAAVVGEHTERLQDLTIRYRNDDEIRLLTAVGPFPFLQTLDILTIVGIRESRFTTDAVMCMLRLSPNIAVCTFNGMVYELNDVAEVLVLPHMNHLQFGHRYSCGMERILDHISTPRLQTLYFPSRTLKFEDLLRFLKRCSQKIVLGCDARILAFPLNEIGECLAMLPQLTQVELIQPADHSADHFIAILTDSPRLVPHLSRISLRTFCPSRAWYQKLITVFSVRRQHIESVQVEWSYMHEMYGEGVRPPDEDMCAALRQLAADGMSIHIGPEDHNYI